MEGKPASILQVGEAVGSKAQGYRSLVCLSPRREDDVSKPQGAGPLLSGSSQAQDGGGGLTEALIRRRSGPAEGREEGLFWTK